MYFSDKTPAWTGNKVTLCHDFIINLDQTHLTITLNNRPVHTSLNIKSKKAALMCAWQFLNIEIARLQHIRAELDRLIQNS